MTNAIYDIIEPDQQVPIILSLPHSGARIPEEILNNINPEFHAFPDDVDWFLEKLYDFCPSYGITVIKANYCRWVIDLNRDPNALPLYNDGRVITGLVPLTDFNGNNLYIRNPPGPKDIVTRMEQYYFPYHSAVSDLIEKHLTKFGRVILFDGHSIRREVPGIRKEPFPDLILGDNDQKTAGPGIINAAESILANNSWSYSHNFPFKGGYITRNYGNPKRGIHALQLEMNKTNYMDDAQLRYDEIKAGKTKAMLMKLMESLIDQVI